MPMYDFTCSCGYTKETFLKLNETEKPECDICGLPMEKKMSAPAFILKGSGWYSDGYSYSKRKISEGAKNEKRV